MYPDEDGPRALTVAATLSPYRADRPPRRDATDWDARSEDTRDRIADELAFSDARRREDASKLHLLRRPTNFLTNTRRVSLTRFRVFDRPPSEKESRRAVRRVGCIAAAPHRNSFVRSIDRSTFNRSVGLEPVSLSLSHPFVRLLCARTDLVDILLSIFQQRQAAAAAIFSR